MRRSIATAVAAALTAVVALSVGCGRSEDEPDSLFDDAGYHVRNGAVYYLNPFPGKASRLDDADASSFEAFDHTYARDRHYVYINGELLAGADARTFELLERPGFSKDRERVYQHDDPISTDPGNFRFLASDLADDSAHVYWTDGSVLSTDPRNFVILSDEDHYLFAKDSSAVFVNGNTIAGATPTTFEVLDGAYSRDRESVFYFDARIDGAEASTFRTLEGPYAMDAARVYWMGEPIDGADPATFVVLNQNFECTADASRAYYRRAVIAGADPATFPVDRPVTGCSETTISFVE